MKSKERTGFLRYSKEGKLEAVYTVKADIDMMNVLVRMFNSQMYFVVNEREGVKVYTASL